MTLFLGILISFLIGSFPSASIAGRIKKVDLRHSGSGNLGATNVFRALGPLAGILVLLSDLGKGFLVTAVISGLFPPDPFIQITLGISAMLGHIFSVFTHFRGGKSVATWMGALLGMSVVVFGATLGFFLFAFLLTKRVSAGSLFGALGTCIVAYPYAGPSPLFFFSLAALVIIVATHRDNIKRLAEGREPPLSQNKTPG